MRPLPREFRYNDEIFFSAYELYLFIGFPKKNWTKWCRTYILESEDLIENEDYYRLELTASEKADNVKLNFAVPLYFNDGLSAMPPPWGELPRNDKILHPGLKIKAVYTKSGKIRHHNKSHTI